MVETATVCEPISTPPMPKTVMSTLPATSICRSSPTAEMPPSGKVMSSSSVKVLGPTVTEVAPRKPAVSTTICWPATVLSRLIPGRIAPGAKQASLVALLNGPSHERTLLGGTSVFSKSSIGRPGASASKTARSA